MPQITSSVDLLPYNYYCYEDEVFPVQAFKPKVHFDYVVEPYKLSRKVEVERRRRRFQSQDINTLLESKNIDKSKLIPSADLKNLLTFEEIHGINHIANFSSLEYYDDEVFDCRTPNEWMSLGMVDGVQHPVPGKAFVPVTLLNSSASNVDSLGGKKLPEYAWMFCAVIDYDPEIKTYNIIILKDFREYSLPRIYILFLAEDPEQFAARIENALARRNECENRISDLMGNIVDQALLPLVPVLCTGQSNECHATCFPFELHSHIHDPSNSSSISLCNAVVSLGGSEQAVGVFHLLYQLFLDCMNITGLSKMDDKTMRRIINLAARFQAMRIHENVLERLEEDVMCFHQRSLCDFIFKEVMKKTPATFPFLVIPEEQFHHQGYKIPNDIPSYPFEETRNYISYTNLYCIEESHLAMMNVADECRLMSENFLFTLAFGKTVDLDNFVSIQSETTTAVLKSLRNNWVERIIHHIKMSFRDINEGWFNLMVKKWHTYEVSKLSRFMCLVKFRMQDALRNLVLGSLTRLLSLFEGPCQPTKNCEENMVWGEDLRQTTYKSSHLPIFIIEILIVEGVGAHYKTNPDEFEKIFENAVTVTHNIKQVHPFLLENLKFSDELLLSSVGLAEEEIVNYRELILSYIKSATIPLKAYVKEYQQFVPLYTTKVEYYMRNFTFKNPNAVEVKEEANIQKNGVRDLEERIPKSMDIGPFEVQLQNLKDYLMEKRWTIYKSLLEYLSSVLNEKIEEIISEFKIILRKLTEKPLTIEQLYDMKDWMETVPMGVKNLEESLKNVLMDYEILDGFCYIQPEDYFLAKWEAIGYPHKISLQIEDTLVMHEEEIDRLSRLQLGDEIALIEKFENLTQHVQGLSLAPIDISKCQEIAIDVRRTWKSLQECLEFGKLLNYRQKLFGIPIKSYEAIGKLVKEFEPYRNLWMTASDWLKWHEIWMDNPLINVDSDEIEKIVFDMQKMMSKCIKIFVDIPGPQQLAVELKNQMEEFRPLIPLIEALRNPGMRQRHWELLLLDTGIKIIPGPSLTFKKCLDLGITSAAEKLCNIAESAGKEYGIESTLSKMEKDWEDTNLEVLPYKDTGTYIIKVTDEITQLLDEQTILVQTLMFSPYKAAFEEQVMEWEHNLRMSQEVLEVWLDAQNKWLYLQPIFSSMDIARQLPNESKKYLLMDRIWRRIMKNAHEHPKIMTICPDRRLLELLKDCSNLLEMVQKGLSDYLETKRMLFPRFYFLSDDELLDILSQAQHPATVQPHLRKCFENIYKLTFGENLLITHMISAEGEQVEFTSALYPEGHVEDWLLKVESCMRTTIQAYMKEALIDIKNRRRNEWVLSWPGQVVIAGSQTYWTARVEAGLFQKNLGKYYKTLLHQLDGLRNLVKGKLSKVERQVLSALITIEVHSRDVVVSLLDKGSVDASDFSWFSQLKYYWMDDNVVLRALNAQYSYGYEYLGNSGRLVITPLTDRCYLTLTSALHLRFGGAPAGPAGTGKTETTKDLAKAFANQCVVFNCSDQLDVIAMGKFFKGLASSGAWACFDEFNRIDVEVLSVVAQQITTIQKAQQARLERFMFEGSDVVLKESCAVFITMNPGYAGRTELPDNLKALFRPVAMMVPNYALIAEISLFSFGFLDAKDLAAKITSTFKLSSEQLSTQDHYDFGMRAVKTVIAAAGNLKREKPDMDERQIVLRALKDVNVPKFVRDDLKLFTGIVSDLFPRMVEDAVEYGYLLSTICEKILARGLLDVEEYVMKVIQLYETTVVRHGLMLVGPAGSGKTTCYEILRDAMTSLKGELSPSGSPFEKVHTYVLNPKSITMGQLYGEYDLQTHEWTDGILSSLVRLGASAAAGDYRWYVFDGPVDAVWIENLNTVLDDNKKLCLSSGEIIKLAPTQTMMFEVADLAVASPATVSRCGMVYLEPGVLGLSPFVTCWLKRLPKLAEPYSEDFLVLFERYLYPSVELVGLKEGEKGEGGYISEIVPTMSSALVMSHLRLLDIRLRPLSGVDNKPPPRKPFLDLMPQLITPWFMFSLIWSVGATCDQDGRLIFSDWLRRRMEEFNDGPSFPMEGIVYDYRLHDGGFTEATESGEPCEPKWLSWMQGVGPYKILPNMRYSDIEVPTMDTVRSSTLLGMLIGGEYPTLCVGPTGTGKTVVAKAKIISDLPKNFLSDIIIFSARTSANQTQDLIDSKLDRRRKGVFGPLLGKKQVFFIDDFNMPALEVFGAQPPIELIRQWMDFKGWYDRKTIGEFRSIVDVNFVCAMGPPGGGRNPVTSRLLRHFHFLAFTELSEESKSVIFGTILKSWLDRIPFTSADERSSGEYALLRPTVRATIQVYSTILQELLPTPAKTHYTFNLRDLSKVFQGILMADPKEMADTSVICRLWYHECHRVFGDRLVSDQDREWFDAILLDRLSQDFGVQDLSSIFGSREIVIFGTFMPGGGADEVDYREINNLEEVTDSPRARRILGLALDEYNSTSRAPMNLVFFQDALCHVARIARILMQPHGNALLLGMGGSGRQSLTKLAAHTCSYKCVRIELTKNYSLNDWREDLKEMMLEAGLHGAELVFLFTDNQIKSETFLEDINNILNAGDVPNIYSIEDIERISRSMKHKVQELGLPPTQANLLSVYIRQLRLNLHLVLAMSPIGEVFRARLRQFPALVNCCTIDWFSAWPDRALQSVATQFFEAIPDFTVEPSILKGLVRSCQHIHQSVITTSAHYLQALSRHNYVTPTAYLELLQSYASLLKKKKDELMGNKTRYISGLDKLATTAVEVGLLRTELEKMKPQLDAATVEVETMLVKIAEDTVIVEETREEVEIEEEAAKLVKAETEAMAADAQRDLDEALPLLEAAESSLKSLNKNDITEVRALKRPPAGVGLVMEAICIIKEVQPIKVPTGKPGVKVNDYWEPSRNLLLDPNRFLKSLMQFDKDSLQEHVIKNLKPYIEDPQFLPEKIITVSKACTSLCQWVHAIYKYYFVLKVVIPKKNALNEALIELAEKEKILEAARARMKAVLDRLHELKKQLAECESKKSELQRKTQLCIDRLERANHLLESLADERTRWSQYIVDIEKGMTNVIGDTLIAGASVAYLTPFTDQYRKDLLRDWMEYLSNCHLQNVTKTNEIAIDSEVSPVPHSNDCSPIAVLGDAILIRKWHLEGLPRDNVSTESAVLLSNSSRWTLFIDPQGQANYWIRHMQRDNQLVVLKLSDRSLLRSLESAIRMGNTVLLENVGEELDPGLDPLLLRQAFPLAGGLAMKLGDSVIPYNDSFKLFITTKLPNPHYTPEVACKVLIVNFALSPSGLTDQLLTLTVLEERPDLEEARSALIMSNAQMRRELKELEDRILHLLSTSQGSPIDDLDLIATLDASKTKSNEIKIKLEATKVTQEDIENTRQGYIPLAVRAQILFFCVVDLSAIDPMYQYSLEWYITIMIASIRQGEKSEITEERVDSINQMFTFNLYSNVCRSLFEQHKLLFAFLLCIRILMDAGKVNPQEWNTFLVTGVPSKELPNPAEEWLSVRSWREIQCLNTLPKFSGIAEEFSSLKDGFREIFDSGEPHRKLLPGRWEKELDSFQHMMLLKCLRPDKVTNAIQEYLVSNLGSQFVEPQSTDLAAMYADSNPTSALVFVLSTGTDPAADLYKFADKMKFNKKMYVISLGQGQGPRAERMLATAIETGFWVFFQNCHLAPSWMPELEHLIETIPPDVHKDFRVWLTSTPSPAFPVSILQNGTKMTVEPPRGIKANMIRAFKSQVAEIKNLWNQFDEKTPKTKWLLFSLCLFHGIVLERRKFGPLGFNIPYEFTDGDLCMCISQLLMFLNEYKDVPFEVLTLTAGNINYGGRVTDSWDQRCIMTIIEDFYNPQVLSEDYAFVQDGTYHQLPASSTIEDYMKYIQSLPINDDPSLFNLHSNADMSYAQNETFVVLETLLSLQPKAVSSSEGQSQEDNTRQVATRILEIIPNPLPLYQIIDKYPVKYEECFNSVLVQEVLRFNRLIKAITSSLNDMIRALKGLVVMSELLEDMAHSLSMNHIPKMWASKAYPSLKPLGAWVTDLKQRIEFLQKWVDEGIPSSFWISGFFFPQAFLTGALQNFARKHVVSIDTLTFSFQILNDKPKERPDDGCCVYGMFLEGARWCKVDHLLRESHPKELYTDMPVVWLRPEANRYPPKSGVYECPVYKILTRAGTLSTTGHSTNYVLTIELPTDKDNKHWTKKGVALICALNY
ncbi:dynein axonemal heavy chain 1-like [Hetaerina americana]|uniref:dynein axonemal heavy chain 1-like n=1 Tax=Hetaerina americana TaxID=62018 RepID=UPI003A7F15C0